MGERSERRRVDGVDLLRGLAILFVLLNHVNMRLRIGKVPYAVGWPEPVVASLVWNGQAGVQIFFAISGFLITTTALRRWGTLGQVEVKGFYALRVARIAPLLLALLAVLSGLHLAGVKNFVVAERVGGLGSALWAALTFHVNVLEATRGYLPGSWDVLWSLSVEEMFYLFFPLVCWALGRGRGLVVLFAVFVVLGPFGRTVWAGENEVWREYSYLGSMDAIAMGCLAAMICARVSFSARGRRVLGWAGGGLLGFMLLFSLQARAWGLGRSGLGMTLLGLGTCLLLIAATQSGWRAGAWLGPLRAMGERSYEIYLTHMFVVFACFEGFLWLGKPGAGVLWLFVVTIVVAVLVGEATARWFSEPMNGALRRRFGMR